MGLAAVLFFIFQGHAQTQDFQPAYAAEQAALTSKCQEAEMDQFRELSRWRSLGDDVLNQTVDRDNLLADYNRAKALRKSGTISQSELDNREYYYEQAETALERTALRLKSAGMTVEIAKLKVIEEGNLGTIDVRLKIIQYRLAIAEIEKQSLLLALGSAEGARDYFAARYETGKKLAEKHLIANSELDRRKSEYMDANSQVEGVKHQIESADSILAGLRLSQERLKKN